MTLTAVALAVVCMGPFEPTFNFAPFGPYDSAVPKPESILGYQPGEKHTFYRDQDMVVRAIANAAPKRVKVFEFGKSWEGRPLRIAVVSSEANIAKLEQLRELMGKVAAGDASDATKKSLESLPVFVWINETIHGNESASFESGMWTLYNLAASKNKNITNLLDRAIVILNPSYNPDGHERFAVWNRSVAVASDHPNAFEGDEPDIIHGRTNHYRFDMNRDRVSFSQAETRAEVNEYFRWNPQVYIDQHGQTSEYFFPPNPMSVHAGVERDRFNKWTEVFGRGNAKRFDQNGWLYFIRESFDFYAACYLDTFAGLNGAIGMTYETDGGRRLNDKKDDGSPLTLELGMAKHFTTAIATIDTAAENRKALLDSFYAFRRKGVTGDHAGKFKRVVVTSADPRPLLRLHEHLSRAHIDSQFATEDFEASDANDYWTGARGAQKFPKGSLVIEMAQPNGQLAKALLEPGQYFEDEFVKRQLDILKNMESKEPKFGQFDFPEFYDLTGWSLVYGYNLRAWWTESAPTVKSADSWKPQGGAPKVGDATVGWVVEYRDWEDALAVYRLAEEGVQVRLLTKPMTLGGESFKAGSFLMLKGRNEPNLADRLRDRLKSPLTVVRPVQTSFPDTGKSSPGGDGIKVLREPKVGVVFGTSEWITGFGSTWFIFEQVFGIEFVPLAASALNGDLSEFSAILFPSGRYGSPSSSFTNWVQGGGCAIVLGSPNWIVGDGKPVKLDPVKLEGDKPIRSIPGTFFAAELDTRSYLSYGYGGAENGKIPFAMNVDGSRFMKASSGDPAVTFPNRDKKLLTGWAWPENSEPALNGAVAVHDQPMGSGRIVTFMWDPTERAMFPGQYGMLLNAIFLGPGR